MTSYRDKKQNKGFININIGIVIFAFILLYLIIKMVIYFTKNEISIYEVPAGKVYAKQTFQGFVIRDEEVVYTDTAGYINYYFLEGDRVQKGGSVYSIGSDKNIYSYLNDANAEIRLSDDAIASLKGTVDELYRSCSTQEDYENLEGKITTVYSRQLDKEVLENLNQIIKSSGTTSGFKVVKAPESGFVSYYVDDYSDVTLDSLNGTYFTADYEGRNVYSSEMYAIGEPVYKMVTSADWTIAVLIDEAMYLRLCKITQADIIINDKDTITVTINPVIRNSEYYCIINLDKYVMMYSDYRFLSIEFDIDDVEGLKIPVSALAYRDYYRIPESYFSTDDNGNLVLSVENYDQDAGLLQRDSVQVDIFFSKDGFRYVDADLLPDNKYIYDKDNENKTSLSAFKVGVEGVYNVNNGYAIFRRIERMETASDNPDYIIVNAGTVGGISIYDHISVNGNDVTEGTVIY